MLSSDEPRASNTNAVPNFGKVPGCRSGRHPGTASKESKEANDCPFIGLVEVVNPLSFVGREILAGIYEGRGPTTGRESKSWELSERRGASQRRAFNKRRSSGPEELSQNSLPVSGRVPCIGQGLRSPGRLPETRGREARGKRSRFFSTKSRPIALKITGRRDGSEISSRKAFQIRVLRRKRKRLRIIARDAERNA